MKTVTHIELHMWRVVHVVDNQWFECLWVGVFAHLYEANVLVLNVLQNTFASPMLAFNKNDRPTML